MTAPISPSEIRNFIQRFFPDLEVAPTADHSGLLQQLVEMVDALPPSMLPTDPQSRADLKAAAHHIAVQVASWTAMGSGTRVSARIPGLPRREMPIPTIFRILGECHDSIVAEETEGLEFIPDQDYREQLRMDLADVETCFNHGQWKAATVLGGALIEAFLLDALKIISEKDLQDSAHYCKITRRGPKTDLNYWDLADCLNIALELKLIDQDTFDVAHKAREFRNFIHPGKAIRTKKSCTPGFAHSVKGGLFLVIEELEKRHQKAS